VVASLAAASRELSLRDLRRFAIARSLFRATDLAAAIQQLGFVQADPIRAPARAQDLILRPRVVDYRAGDLERRYGSLEVEEDFYVNYGFVPRALGALMHPRKPQKPWPPSSVRRARELLAFVRERGEVHPRDVDAHFAHGSVTNYWGGTSNATTHLLDAMHYRGLLRVVRRERGIRIYAVRIGSAAARAVSQSPLARSRARFDRRARLDQLIDVIVATYAPLPVLSLNALLARLRYATPQWLSELKPAIARAKLRMGHAHIEGLIWYWPAAEDPRLLAEAEPRLCLLAPFDPVVWDRRRFELFWGWPYRFEAYTPAAKRRWGYYALPLLWQDQVIGWANLSFSQGRLTHEIGYVSGRAPRAAEFRRSLACELEAMRDFLRMHETE
jgi:uncharacterized protein YcaQ